PSVPWVDCCARLGAGGGHWQMYHHLCPLLVEGKKNNEMMNGAKCRLHRASSCFL
ncbi:unnamed protein product, partial [Lampetra fluviatilis]